MYRSGFVAIAGRPNAGKSTLLNRVINSQVSIVSPKAQTTRERVLGILTEKHGQLVFVDTPGIHQARDGGLNAYMVNEAREALRDTSAVWYLVDPFSDIMHEEIVLEILAGTKSPIFPLLNKVDIETKKDYSKLIPEIEAKAAELGVKLQPFRRLSAKEGVGVPGLLAETWECLPEGPVYYPDPEQISDRPMRFFVAEKIREQLLRHLGDELPYSCAVEIERFDELVKPWRIEAIIHVERDSQKGMVIGKNGSKIKDIGVGARGSIESFLGQQVFLGLRVKVLKDWTRDAQALKNLGYHLPGKSA